jgi:hypothetical protein
MTTLNLSNNTSVASKQQKMIDAMQSVGLTATQDDIDNIALDCANDETNKALNY